MKKTDIAYLAGLFDGEGCICIGKEKARGERPHPSYHLECSVSMCNEYLPNLYRFSFGGSVFFYKDRHPNHQPAWQWHISARKASGFLNTILPYLTIKKGEAELAIKFQSAKRYSGRPKTEGEFALEEAQKILLASFKKKSGVIQ